MRTDNVSTERDWFQANRVKAPFEKDHSGSRRTMQKIEEGKKKERKKGQTHTQPKNSTDKSHQNKSYNLTINRNSNSGMKRKPPYLSPRKHKV